MTNRLIVICAAVYLAQALEIFCDTPFAMNAILIREGFWLNLLTYAFLHGNFWHLALNAIAFYFIGNAIERYESGKTVLAVFLGGSAAGALCWLGMMETLAVEPFASTLVGASAGIAALFAYFSIDNRSSEISALLFYVVPVRMRAWVLFAALTAISVFFLFFSEIPSIRDTTSAGGAFTVGHSAHIGGLLFGAVYALAAELLRKRNGNVQYF